MALSLMPANSHSVAEPTASRPRRPWRDKFRIAFRGLKLGARGDSSFFVHFFFMALVLAAATVLGCSAAEWCLLIGCIGAVLAAELFNSSLETLFRALDEETKSHGWPALDIAAGAVLLTSVTASVIGCIIFLPKLAAWIGLS